MFKKNAKVVRLRSVGHRRARFQLGHPIKLAHIPSVRPTTAASFDGVLTDAQGSFDAMAQSLVSADDPTRLKTPKDDMKTAADELSSAAKAARAYIDSQKPSDLAAYKTHWDQGRAWWNESVRAIWSAASSTPPTVDNAPV